jgi:hypothetical protein
LAVKLAAIPDLDDVHLEIVAHAVKAMFSGNNFDADVFFMVTFYAKNQDILLYFIMGEDKAMQLSYIAKGDSFEEQTQPYHNFRLYNAYNPDIYHTYTVEGTYGEHQHIHASDARIVGECATTGDMINIPDAYQDDRFNRQVDARTGIHTNGILVISIKDDEGENFGKIQMCNKKNPDGTNAVFTSNDTNLATHACITCDCIHFNCCR